MMTLLAFYQDSILASVIANMLQKSWEKHEISNNQPIQSKGTISFPGTAHAKFIKVHQRAMLADHSQYQQQLEQQQQQGALTTRSQKSTSLKGDHAVIIHSFNVCAIEISDLTRKTSSDANAFTSTKCGISTIVRTYLGKHSEKKPILLGRWK